MGVKRGLLPLHKQEASLRAGKRDIIRREMYFRVLREIIV